MPITAAGQVIDGVTAVADASDPQPLETTAGDVGTYETGGLNGLSYLNMLGTQVNGLRVTSPTYDFSSGTDRMTLTVTNANTDCQGVAWDTTDAAFQFAHRHNVSATDRLTTYMDAAQTLSDNALIGDYAAWGHQAGATSNSTGKNNKDATTWTQPTATSDVHSNLGINIGRYAGTFLPWFGRLYEVILWEGAQGSLPARALVEQYVTAKYGLAWVV
jgi:hypothetical protein